MQNALTCCSIKVTLILKIIIINGPNLNLLGKREPEIYGTQTMEDYLKELQAEFPDTTIELYQSNIEGELIDKLQQVGFSYDGILLNAGGYTHTSVAIADAVGAITTPVIEVHISDPKKREAYRHVSMLEDKCAGTISGLGMDSYKVGLERLLGLV